MAYLQVLITASRFPRCRCPGAMVFFGGKTTRARKAKAREISKEATKGWTKH
jgi:hypothetical protein